VEHCFVNLIDWVEDLEIWFGNDDRVTTERLLEGSTKVKLLKRQQKNVGAT